MLDWNSKNISALILITLGSTTKLPKTVSYSNSDFKLKNNQTNRSTNNPFLISNSRSNDAPNSINENESVPTHINNNKFIAEMPTQDTLDILFTIVTNLNVDYNFSTPSQPFPNSKKRQSSGLK